jgi:hypothetical protein
MDPPGRRLDYPIGTKVAKYFDEGVFHGQVVRYDPFYGVYLILYDDGDKEEMLLRDLEKHVLDEHSHSIFSPDSMLEHSSGSAKRKRESEPPIKTEETEAKEARHMDVVTSSSTRNDESGDGELAAGIVCINTDDAQNEQTSNELDEEDMPSSIDAIIRYMDRLEPEKEYYKRQQDSRSGCSKTRRRLREYKKENTNDIAVSWHKLGNVWCPPSLQILKALIERLKIIISEMSPTKTDKTDDGDVAAEVIVIDDGEETQTEQIDDELDEDEMPSNIDSISRYMDQLVQGKNNCKRQQHTRGGCLLEGKRFWNS